MKKDEAENAQYEIIKGMADLWCPQVSGDCKGCRCVHFYPGKVTRGEMNFYHLEEPRCRLWQS